MSHVSVGTNDFPRAKAFYDAVLGALGVGVVMARRGRVSTMGRSITVRLCMTWMGTRSRRCSGMLLWVERVARSDCAPLGRHHA